MCCWLLVLWIMKWPITSSSKSFSIVNLSSVGPWIPIISTSQNYLLVQVGRSRPHQLPKQSLLNMNTSIGRLIFSNVSKNIGCLPRERPSNCPLVSWRQVHLRAFSDRSSGHNQALKEEWVRDAKSFQENPERRVSQSCKKFSGKRLKGNWAKVAKVSRKATCSPVAEVKVVHAW